MSLNPLAEMTKADRELELQWSEQDKIDLINFLKTFTGDSCLENPNFSNPN